MADRTWRFHHRKAGPREVLLNSGGDWISRLAGNVTVQPDGCWTVGANRDTYADSKVGDKQERTHRLVYLAVHGPIPDGWHVHHRCETKACINPDHLEALSASDHMAHHAHRRRTP
jgi:hypothetical protein